MKRFFLRGLAALLPTILTLWVFTALFAFVSDFIAVPITRAIHWTLITNQWGRAVLESTTPIRVFDVKYVDPKVLEDGIDAASALAAAKRDSGFLLDLGVTDRTKLYADLDQFLPPSFGFAVGMILIFVLGFFLRGYVGALLFARGERILFSFPFVSHVYPYAKKIVEFFLEEKTRIEGSHRSVVAVPYPSDGRYTLGFVTSEGPAGIDEALGGDYVAVFLPSSPTPMTGYVVLMKRSDLIPLDMTLDQAMAFIVSGGVISPTGSPADPTAQPPRVGAPRSLLEVENELPEPGPASVTSPGPAVHD